ncbi:MAG TPA: serine/threonine-protein kinase [Gemmatimonadales bacterium]|nr:serine/threonine-protein kinase [Gemmatimonadales bacterium]
MSQDNLVGRTIAGYLLVKQTGEGGTALVYQAEHPQKGKAAVKVLRGRQAQDPVAVKRFLKEGEFGVRASHANIIRTLDYGQEGDLYWLALEWAEGEPLSSFLAASGRVAPLLAGRIIGQLGEAISTAHRSGIVHRDLKPANIMYDPATQTARLLDFGIARDMEDSPEARLTRAGFFVGTLQYVAPEALSGELVGEQADVYSVATIAYQLLTNKLPFSGKTPRELFQQLLSQNPIPLSQALDGVAFSPALETAVMRGLERDLGKRWKTVEEFANAFVAAASAEPAQEKKGGGLLSRLFGR